MTVTNYEIFSNPPIVEALMDVRVKLDKDLNVENLGTLHDSIKDRYDQIKKQYVFSGTVNLGENTTFDTQPSTFNGYMITSEKEKKVVQSRLDGFTYSKLNPYEHWDSFFSEGKSLFESYSEIAKPKSIFRIALRHINRIEIPIDFKDFNEYVLTNPQIASGIPQAVSNFFLRLEIPNYELNSKATVSLTMDKITPKKRVPLIFDIDVFREQEYASNIEEMWNGFEDLKAFKNQIFFNTITDKCKELFR